VTQKSSKLTYKMENNSIYSLNLNDFSNNVTTVWQELRQEKDFCDVTLACEGKQIEAHKVILSGFSPVFKNILKQNPHQHPLLYLRGVKHCELVNILDFMYQGSVSIAQEQLNSFLDVSKDFQIKGLTEHNKETPTEQHESPKSPKPQSQNANKRYGRFNDNYPSPKKKRPLSQPQVVHLEDTQQELVKSEPDVIIESEENMMVLSQNNENNAPLRIEDNAVILDEGIDDYDDYGGYEEDQNQGYGEDGVFRDPSNGRVRYSCNQCLNTYTDKSTLSTHIKSIHEGLRYCCEQCNYKATTKSNLKKHVDSVHEKIRYHCEHCEHTTTEKTKLNKHIKMVHYEHWLSINKYNQ